MKALLRSFSFRSPNANPYFTLEIKQGKTTLAQLETFTAPGSLTFHQRPSLNREQKGKIRQFIEEEYGTFNLPELYKKLLPTVEEEHTQYLKQYPYGSPDEEHLLFCTPPSHPCHQTAYINAINGEPDPWKGTPLPPHAGGGRNDKKPIKTRERKLRISHPPTPEQVDGMKALMTKHLFSRPTTRISGGIYQMLERDLVKRDPGLKNQSFPYIMAFMYLRMLDDIEIHVPPTMDKFVQALRRTSDQKPLNPDLPFSKPHTEWLHLLRVGWQDIPQMSRRFAASDPDFVWKAPKLRIPNRDKQDD